VGVVVGVGVVVRAGVGVDGLSALGLRARKSTSDKKFMGCWQNLHHTTDRAMLARVRPLARGSLARPFATTAKPPPAPVLPVDFDASPAKGPWYMNLKPPLRLHPTKLLWSASKGKTDSKAPLPALPLAPSTSR